MTLGGARERFSEVAAARATGSHAAAIRTGFAELRPDETPSALIARADGQLLDSRRGSPLSSRYGNGRRGSRADIRAPVQDSYGWSYGS